MPYLLDKPRVEFRHRPLLFIDMEYTGLDPARHEIIEIAALLVSQPDLNITNSYYAKVAPRHIVTADPKSLKVTSYSPSAWKEAIPLRQALLDLTDLAPDCLLAGWGIQTEWEFLNAALATENLTFFYYHHLIEVYTLAFVKFFRAVEPKFLNLGSTARALGISIDRHKPDSDISATFEIFKILVGGFPHQNPA